MSEPTTPAEGAERWRKYAEAMDAVTGGICPGSLIDAVMAVADAENADLRAAVAQVEPPRPGPVSGLICTEEEAHAAGMDVVPSTVELTGTARGIVAATGGAPTPEVDLARAVPLLCAALDRARAEAATLRDALGEPDVEYGVRIPGSSWPRDGVLRDGDTFSRTDQQDRLERSCGCWPDAHLVQRTVRRGPWTPAAPATAPRCDCEAEVHAGAGFWHQPDCATRTANPIPATGEDTPA